MVLISRMQKEDKTFFLAYPPTIDGPIPKIEPEKATIGSKENPHARKDYEMAMLIDPQTSQVPIDIRRGELKFASRLPKKSSHDLRVDGTAAENWKSIGPYNVGGRTRAISIDVSNEEIILAGGVSGGMWRSEDEGRSWEKTTVPESIHSVSCIAQDQRSGKEHIWYYGTGEFTSNSASKKGAPYRGDGVFKSMDGGKSWSQLFSTSEGVPNYYNSQFQYVWKLLPNSRNLTQDEVFSPQLVQSSGQ